MDVVVTVAIVLLGLCDAVFVVFVNMVSIYGPNRILTP